MTSYVILYPEHNQASIFRGIYYMKKKFYLFAILTLFCLMPLVAHKTDASAKIIYTTSTKVNAAADKIIKKVSSEEMTKEQKLRQVYVYLVKTMRYSYRTGHKRVHVSAKDLAETKAIQRELERAGQISYSSKFRNRYANVLSLQGTCYGMSKVFCILANHLGFKANMVHGKYVTSGGRRSDHYWCYVYINGHKRYFDVQIANYYWKKHRTMKYAEMFYARSKSAKGWRKHHRG